METHEIAAESSTGVLFVFTVRASDGWPVGSRLANAVEINWTANNRKAYEDRLAAFYAWQNSLEQVGNKRTV